MITDPKSGKEWKDPGVTQETIDQDVAAIDALLETGEQEPEIYMQFLEDLEFHNNSLAIRNTIDNCSICKLRQSCRQPVPFLGHHSRPIVAALGEAPGATEDVLKLGFCGKSGALLRACAKRSGVEIPDFINTCCCRPPGNRTPTSQEIDDCSGNLKAQVEHINPWMLLCFGATALAGATGRKDLKITRDHGRFFKTRFTNPDTQEPIWGYSFFHPRYTMQNMEVSKLKKQDKETLQKVKHAQLVCRKWMEDWDRLAELIVLKEMFDISILASPGDNLATLESVMNSTMKKEPYLPDENWTGWDHPDMPKPDKKVEARQTYLARMDDKEMDIDDIPF